MGTDEAMLVAVPFLAAEMTVDQFPLAGRVICYRRHSLGGGGPAGAGKGRRRRRRKGRGSVYQAERVKGDGEVEGGGGVRGKERGCGRLWLGGGGLKNKEGCRSGETGRIERAVT